MQHIIEQASSVQIFHLRSSLMALRDTISSSETIIIYNLQIDYQWIYLAFGLAPNYSENC